MLRFPSSWLNLPVAGADPEQRGIAEREVEAGDPLDLVSTLWRSLRLLLLNGVSSGEAVAKHLAMHRRTLNRRLKALGTSFQDVQDQVRFEVARQLLGATDLALDDVAAALGYASQSPFERAFRRWFGTTPGRWRDRN